MTKSPLSFPGSPGPAKTRGEGPSRVPTEGSGLVRAPSLRNPSSRAAWVGRGQPAHGGVLRRRPCPRGRCRAPGPAGPTASELGTLTELLSEPPGPSWGPSREEPAGRLGGRRQRDRPRVGARRGREPLGKPRSLPLETGPAPQLPPTSVRSSPRPGEAPASGAQRGFRWAS